MSDSEEKVVWSDASNDENLLDAVEENERIYTQQQILNKQNGGEADDAEIEQIVSEEGNNEIGTGKMQRNTSEEVNCEMQRSSSEMQQSTSVKCNDEIQKSDGEASDGEMQKRGSEEGDCEMPKDGGEIGNDELKQINSEASYDELQQRTNESGNGEIKQSCSEAGNVEIKQKYREAGNSEIKQNSGETDIGEIKQSCDEAGNDKIQQNIRENDNDDIKHSSNETGNGQIKLSSNEEGNAEMKQNSDKACNGEININSSEAINGSCNIKKSSSETCNVEIEQNINEADNADKQTNNSEIGNGETKQNIIKTDHGELKQNSSVTGNCEVKQSSGKVVDGEIKASAEVRHTGTSNKTRKSRRKKTQTRQKLKYLSSSSSDDDIPLSLYVQKKTASTVSFDSDNDLEYVPKSKDLNSSDTEFYSDISEDTRAHIDFMEQLKKSSKKRKTNLRERHTTRKQRKQDGKSNDISANEIYHDQQTVQQVKDISLVQAVMQKSIVAAHEGRLDQVLNSHGMKRINIPPDGNCFFGAVLHSNEITGTSDELREILCIHLEQNAEEYIGFLLNTFNPNDEESFVVKYLQEIENLKQSGYWSTKIADFLPLAVANLYSCTVTIYTSKLNQQVIKVQPSLKKMSGIQSNFNEIRLAYTAIPGILEHFDACEMVIDDNVNNDRFENSPAPSDDVIMTTPVSPGPSTSGNVNLPTPNKDAKFMKPVKKQLTRKRQCTPDNWKRNIRKKLKLSGQEYVSSRGKTIQKKTIKKVDCTKCRYRCSKITEENRQTIFDTYWGMGSYERQKDFICAHVQERKTKTNLGDDGQVIEKTKSVSREYRFDVQNESIRVCKKFFRSTLCVGEAFITHALENKIAGHFEGSERRGKGTPSNKTSVKRLEKVRQHVTSFPAVDSYYIRKESNRKYLETSLNITKMYELYKEKCEKEGDSPVKFGVYRNVFNEEFNISFHKPKKDQCKLCSKYHVAVKDCVLTDEMKDGYELHQKRKLTARKEKENDKNAAKQDKSIHTCTFDLQSVLYTPCSLVSVMYYLRKLCCYNLSVYSLGDGKGSCFVWSEVNGKRGSCEVATSIYLYLQSLPQSVEKVVLYSDACAGQNKNKIMASCLLYSVNKIPNINQIDHTFLESGHTQMECDSMHAAIEFVKKRTQIFVPSQWHTVITMSRRGRPYTVIPMKFGDFLDFKDLQTRNVKATHSASGVPVRWSDMRWLKFSSTQPTSCLFKYELNDNAFERIELTTSCETNNIPKLYNNKLPITSAKKKDLTTICKQGIVPSEFHDYYKSLPASQNAKEKLPEPDADESDTDTE